MEVNILAMLQTAMAVGVVTLIGAWGFYVWFKHSKKKHHGEELRHN